MKYKTKMQNIYFKYLRVVVENKSWCYFEAIAYHAKERGIQRFDTVQADRIVLTEIELDFVKAFRDKQSPPTILYIYDK